MKIETLGEWKERTGKEPKKLGHAEAYTRVYSHGWITKNKKGIVLKKKGPVKRP